ncbi:MAG: ATP-binding protein [Bacteroidota bacterium]
MIERIHYVRQASNALQHFPACALLGPRQCGKTTLALELKKHFEQVHHFDLEDPLDFAQFDAPKILLEKRKGLVIIDEIQRRPELFPYFRALLDRNPDLKLLLLGSASKELLWKSSETLAGRIKYISLTPFRLGEVSDVAGLWERGGFPRAYLAPTETVSEDWRKAYITTFLERDLLTLDANISPQTLRKLWMMLAHYHGNILNYAELGRSLALTDKSIRRQIDLLESAFMVRILQPWYANIKKRQIKAPKLYIRDSGLLHTLLGLSDKAIHRHPKLGASWEGFALEQVLFTHEIDDLDCYYWRTHDGAELDLLVVKGGERMGYEFKYTDAPRLTSAMPIVLNDLSLDALKVIIPGKANFLLHEKIEVIGLEQLRRR